MVDLKDKTFEELRKMASKKKIEGRSKMNKSELIKALKKKVSIKKKMKGGFRRFWRHEILDLTPENMTSLQTLITQGRAKAFFTENFSTLSNTEGYLEEITESYQNSGYDSGPIKWNLISINNQGNNANSPNYEITIEYIYGRTHTGYLRDLGLLTPETYQPIKLRYIVPKNHVKYIRFQGIIVKSEQFQESRQIRSHKQWWNRPELRRNDPFVVHNN